MILVKSNNYLEKVWILFASNNFYTGLIAIIKSMFLFGQIILLGHKLYGKK